MFTFLRPWRLRLVKRDELRYLRGVARSVAKLQRSHVKHGEWNARLQAKNRRLRGQIRVDQVYIDALEAELTPHIIGRVREAVRPLRVDPGASRGRPPATPEVWAMVAQMQERVDREHAWVHRLEDEISRLRNVVDQALVQCVDHPYGGDETAKAVARILQNGQRKVPQDG